MGKYRNSEILASEAINSSGTKNVDVNLRDAITRLIIQVKATNNGNTPVAHPAKILSKIELLDGSDRIFSMKGIAAQALSFYDDKVPPYTYVCYANDVMSIVTFILNFGRFLYDPELALMPDRFNNLQLQITHNLALGGSSPDAANLRVRADVFDEMQPSPMGFLMSKEHYTFADSSSAIENVELPTDHPIRKILIQSNADDKMPYEQINQVKISEDLDKRVIYEGYQSDFIKYLAAMWPMYQEQIYGYAASGGTENFVGPTYEPHIIALSDDATAAYLKPDFTGGQGQTITGSANTTFRGTTHGFCPHGAVPYPFGRQDVIEDWLDVQHLSSLRAKLTQGASVSGSETIEIITQQMRRY